MAKDKTDLQIIHHFRVVTSAESTSKFCVIESQWQSQIQMSWLYCGLWVLPYHHPHFIFPSQGHFGRFRGFQPNLTGSTQTAGASPRAQPDYVNKAASSTGELKPDMWSSGNRHELTLYAPRGNFLQKQTSDTARGNCFPLEISIAGTCLLKQCQSGLGT